jgi:hypothetical protein
VYDNVFKIASAPPNNEYSGSDYSTNAIRISDYNAPEGSDRGCIDNRVYRNRIEITGKAYPEARKQYMPMAYGVFMSVGAGQNYIYDNEMVVMDDLTRKDDGETYAFYVGGSKNGGVYHGNKVTSNRPFFWISNRYGDGDNVLIYENTFTKAQGASDFAPIRLGWYKSDADNIGWYSNKLQGLNFKVAFDGYNKASEIAVGWTLTVNTEPGAEVVITGAEGAKAAEGKADDEGVFTARLAEFKLQGPDKKTECPDYSASAAGKTQQVKMTQDRTITLK